MRPHFDSWVGLQQGYQDPTYSRELCKDKVDRYYYDYLMEKTDPNIFVKKQRLYPNLSIQCRKEAISKYGACLQPL